MTAGWQQEPVPPRRTPATCIHFGAMFASLTLSVHPAGHVWVCPCGQEFVVVSDGPDGAKRLAKRR